MSVIIEELAYTEAMLNKLNNDSEEFDFFTMKKESLEFG